MGAFLSVLATPPVGRPGIGAFLSRTNRTIVADWRFFAGIGIWTAGFASDIGHDEVLLDMRRQLEPKLLKLGSCSRNSQEGSTDTKPRYAIPNYLSEWFEWLGFAISALALATELPVTHVDILIGPCDTYLLYSRHVVNYYYCLFHIT